MTHWNKGKPNLTYESLFRDFIDSDIFGVQDFELKTPFCPDAEDNEKFYEVKNSYTNEIDRKSFSIEV